MTLCNCLPSIWTDPLLMGISSAYKELYSKLNALSRPKECSECKYIDFCGSCPARLLSDAGDPCRTCSSICNMAKDSYLGSLVNDSGNLRDKIRNINVDCAQGGIMHENQR